MNILGRINLPDRSIPVRAYLHAKGVEAYAPVAQKLFDTGRDVEDKLEAAKEYLETALRPETIPRKIFQREESGAQKPSYILAFLWGNEEKERMMDCFGFYGVPVFPHWPGNPDVQAWVLCNGMYIPEQAFQREITCGDGLMILGQEEAYRRRCRSLEEYLNNPPEILQPKRVHI